MKKEVEGEEKESTFSFSFLFSVLQINKNKSIKEGRDKIERNEIMKEEKWSEGVVFWYNSVLLFTFYEPYSHKDETDRGDSA